MAYQHLQNRVYDTESHGASFLRLHPKRSRQAKVEEKTHQSPLFLGKTPKDQCWFQYESA
jgi:hypothetical protein